MAMDNPPTTAYERAGDFAPHHAHGHGLGHVRRDTISFPVHSSDYSFAQSPHGRLSLSWQDEEERKRLESAQEHGYWWTGSAEEGEDEMYEPHREGTFEMGYNVNTEGMGFDEAATSSFDQAYLEVSLRPINHLSQCH
jgi:hypothetical protein